MFTAPLREHRNVGTSERMLTALAGVSLFALAVKLPRARAPLAAASMGLLLRGATGYCPGYAAIGVSSGNVVDTRRALAGPKGSHVSTQITIAQPPGRVYAFWRDLGQLSEALPETITVEPLDDLRSRWSLWRKAGAEKPLAQWTAQIINEDPDRLIGWKTVEEADIVSAGSVRFVEAPGSQGTEVHVRLQYAPPLGKLGASIASLFGHGAARVVNESLRDIKRFLELGRHVTLKAE